VGGVGRGKDADSAGITVPAGWREQRAAGATLSADQKSQCCGRMPPQEARVRQGGVDLNSVW
jgi:hypothetical protein